MTINELKKWYEKSNKSQNDINYVVIQLCDYLVELDKVTLDNILAWSKGYTMDNVNEVSCYWYKESFITIDFVKVVLSKVINEVDYDKCNKYVWRNIYKNRLSVKHGMIMFEQGSQFGARYGANKEYYCIYK